MLEQVKLALRITTGVFDAELNGLISAALDDLALAGVNSWENRDKPLVIRACVTYCKAHFGEPDGYGRLKAAYDEQKAQLKCASEYTDWE